METSQRCPAWERPLNQQRAREIFGDLVELAIPEFPEVALREVGISGLCLSAALILPGDSHQILLHRPIGWFDRTERWHELSATNAYVLSTSQDYMMDSQSEMPNDGFAVASRTFACNGSLVKLVCSGFPRAVMNSRFLSIIIAYFKLDSSSDSIQPTQLDIQPWTDMVRKAITEIPLAQARRAMWAAEEALKEKARREAEEKKPPTTVV